MKKITLLLMMLLTVTFGFSQELVTNGDFESAPSSAWYGNAFNIVLQGSNNVNEAEVVNATPAEPFLTNLSQEIILESGKTYEMSFDAFTDATTSSRTILVGLGQAAAPFQALTEQPTLTATSQTFTYQFTVNYGDGVADRVLFDMAAETGFVFLDNVSVVEVQSTCDNGVQDGDETGVDCGGSCAPCATPPTVAAPTPPARASADVVNVYSAAYAGSQVLTPDTFGVAGNNSTATEGSAEGDDFWGIVFDGGDFVGFNLNSGVDASEMTHFHMDYWTVGTPTGGVMNPKWSNHSGGHLTGETHAAIHTFAPGQDGQWNSLDIEISQFNVGVLNGGIVADRSVLSQLIMQASGASAALFDQIYFDNVYFHKNTTLSNDSFSKAEFKAYPNPTQNVWNIRTTESIKKVEVYNITGRLVKEVNVNASEAVINANELSSGVYLAKISNEFDQTRTIKLIKE